MKATNPWSKQEVMDKNSFALISGLFTSPKIKLLNNSKHRKSITNLYNEVSEAIESQTEVTTEIVFEFFYDLLLENYRCEYIYRNEIAKQLLMEQHRPGEAVMLNEVDVDASRADVVIINGTSTVYEIKTEYDSWERLPSQIDSYKQVFDHIYVVTTRSKLASLRGKIDRSVGIVLLQKNGRLLTFRKAHSNKANVAPLKIFGILRKEEYLRIIEKHYGSVPDVEPISMFKEHKKMFGAINASVAHEYMVDELKKRTYTKHQNELFDNLPNSLKSLALTTRFSKSECEFINRRLKSSL